LALEEQLLGPQRRWEEDVIVERTVVDPRPSRAELDRSYWLCRCEGFRVESPAGRVGFVEGLRFRSRIDLPDLLEVSAGRLGRRVLMIPVADVESVESGEELISLRADPIQRRRRVPAVVVRLGSLIGAGHVTRTQ
jgi:hypothetical protein